jgi:hypothetical protein
MTILGKILVIVNLVFSLVTGFLIISVFVTRTNWKDGFDKLRKRYDVAEANARTYYTEWQEAKRAGDEEGSRLKKDLVAAQKERDLVKESLKDRETQYQALEQRTQLSGTDLAAATEELNRRKAEIDNLKQVVTSLNDKVVKLEGLNKELRDEAVGARITANSEHERSTRLLAELETISKEAERRSASGTSSSGGGTAARPPQEDVEGVVTEIDARSGLVTVSIGSDHGLAKGNTLEVFRLKPRPEYVGMITILDTHFHESVARPVAPLRAGQIQKGDMVASRIQTSRR